LGRTRDRTRLERSACGDGVGRTEANTTRETAKRWLVTIAHLVEMWPALHVHDQETAYGVTTPAGAVAVMIGRDVPGADVQRAVVAGLPNVLAQDWATAARQIRESAARV